ncbi:MAG: hypothetical protein ACRD0C_09530 [Acidimicrobiia bacterium]
MRFEELAYRVDGLAVTVPFHRTLTVVSGLGPALRRPWAERALGVLRGGPLATAGTLVFVDGSGSRVRLVRDSRGQASLTDLESGENLLTALAEGSALDFLTLLGLEADDVAAIMLLDPTSLERDPNADADGEAPPPSAEIAEAREVLARVQAEYDQVRAAQGRVAELRARQEELDHQIRNFDEELDRRRHGRVAHAVLRLEAELAQLTGTEPAEQLTAEAALAAAGVAKGWQSAREQLTSARTAFAERRRLDPRALAHALELPVDAPAGLEALHTAYLAATQRRTQLVAQLNEGTDSELPTPSAPWVLSLARIDHPDLWTRAEKLMAVKTRAAELSMGLGGTGQHRDMVGALETAHQAVEQAERDVANARMPALALAAKRRLAKACENEHAVLTKAGFVSWLAFQMRRIDVLLEPDALEALRVAELEAQLAAAAWSELAGDVDPAAALATRDEIDRYAHHLAANVSDIDATEALRKELAEIVEPAYFEARAELLEACGPFDVDLEHATSEVAAIVSEARHARLQATLEAAERSYQQAESELQAALTAAGFPGPGDLPSRVAAVTHKAAEVAAALETPKTTRDTHEVEADLAAARAELNRWSRPDWDEAPLVTDAPLPDTASLAQERADVAAEADGIERTLPDPGRLSDRREALARRVAILEANSGAGSRLLPFEEAEMVLLGRFSQARRVGPEAEPVPIVVDDALAGFPRHDKWRLLDLLARLGEASQVVYLTDDPDTAEWAAARARQGNASLVRPDAVSSVA